MKSSSSKPMVKAVESSVSKCKLAKVEANGHIHASNCGHKSYMHDGMIVYEDSGKFFYMHEDHMHETSGPKAASVIPLRKK